MMDLIIRNAVIVDGTGSARNRGDIGISDGLISAIGEIEAQGREEIVSAQVDSIPALKASLADAMC